MPGNGLISLRQAASVLGVHPATVRLWADKGEIPSTRTAGGHRRFRRSDLEAWSAAKLRGALPGAAVIVHSALGRARFDLSEGILDEQAWYRRLDAATRPAHREAGRRLLTLLLKYLSDEARAESALDEARAIGGEYEKLGRASGLSLTETVRAYLFFREHLHQSVFDTLNASAVTPQTFKSWRDLESRVGRFTDEVLIALVEAYHSGERTGE